MLLCMTVASSFCVPSATQAVFAAEIQHNELIDGGITGSIYEQQFDETVAFIYELREEGYSFEKINEVLESSNALSEPSSLKSTKGLDPSDKFYDYAHLNSIEKKLYKENKAKALLCLANGKLALQYSEDLYKSSVLHNGNGEAFRHTLWNYGMGIDVGQSFAKKWADAQRMEQPDSLHLKRKWTCSIMTLDEDSQRHIQIPSVTLHSRRILRQKCVQENAEELATANL